ncbi:MAG TPA: DHA2 family efflux MFS transporter permease subunit [Pantanalinema sp.]
MAVTTQRRGLPNPFAHLITDQNYMWWAALPVIMGMFIVIIDSSIVNVALPHIMAAFGSNVDDIEWISTGYMLAAAAMMPTTGFLADRIGRKKLYAIAIFLFTVTSMLCGAAWSAESLIFFRILQGIAGGAIQPVGQAIVFEAFPPEKRGMSMAIVGIGAMLAPTLGPTLGGYLVEYINWRWIFYVNLIPGLIATFMAASVLRETVLKNVKMDVWGFVSMAVFLSAFLVGVSDGHSKGWDSPYILGLFAVAAVSFGIFLVVELWRKEPLIDLRLFSNFTYSAGTVASVVMGVGLFGGMFLLPVFLQTVMGYDAVKTGLIMLPSGLTVGLMMPIAGILSNRLDPRVPLIGGLGLMGLSLILQSHMTPETPLATIYGWTILRGIGMGLAFPSMNQTALGAVPIQKIGQASGLFNVTRQIGGSFGIAILATILSQRTAFHTAIIGQDAARNGLAGHAVGALKGLMMSHGSNALVAQQQAGAVIGMLASKQAAVLAFQDTFWISGIVMFAGAIPALFLVKQKHRGQAGHAPMAVIE